MDDNDLEERISQALAEMKERGEDISPEKIDISELPGCVGTTARRQGTDHNHMPQMQNFS